jgi:flavodoxin
LGAGMDASRGKQAEIEPTKRSPADYDLVVIGTPIWAWSPTPAIRTYIAKNDLSGKKVALFFTQDSDKPAAIEKTKALLPNADIVGELTVVRVLANKGDAEKKIADWCSTLKTT